MYNRWLSPFRNRFRLLGLRIAAPWLQGPDCPTRNRHAAMPAATGKSSDKSDDCAGMNCPYKVLGIPQDADVVQAVAAAEGAVMQLSAREGSAWILNMKLAAFAAIVSKQVGEDQAWNLYQQIRPKNLDGYVFVDHREARDVPALPAPDDDAPDWGDMEDDEQRTVERPEETGPQPNGNMPPLPEAADDADGAGSSIMPAQQGGTSQGPQEECFWWQVKKGHAKKRRWGWVDENVNSRLEEAFHAGLQNTTAEIDGWTYEYDLVTMIQTSPVEERTEREIRRVRYDSTSAED